MAMNGNPGPALQGLVDRGMATPEGQRGMGLLDSIYGGGTSGGILDLVRRALGQGSFGMGGGAGKKGGGNTSGYTPADTSGVPTATGSFNSRMDPSQRAALLQAMVARSRAGGTPTPAPAAPTGG